MRRAAHGCYGDGRNQLLPIDFLGTEVLILVRLALRHFECAELHVGLIAARFDAITVQVVAVSDFPVQLDVIGPVGDSLKVKRLIDRQEIIRRVGAQADRHECGN